jgi:LmbE family N-acetylglucosaminyl deacetylase
MKILVIAAHPDDEVLGCGGTIARFSAEGASVSILILANGLTSRADFDASRQLDLLRVHHDRARRAGEILGAKEVNLAGFPDQKMDTIPLLEVTQAIEREITRVQPHMVFTHHPGDLNMDHAITHRATLTATRPMPKTHISRVLCFEIPSSTEWAFQVFRPTFQPQVFYDISNSLDRKIAAMEIYESEVCEAPHPRSSEALRSLAAVRGASIGLHSAEAFQLVRETFACSRPIL